MHGIFPWPTLSHGAHPMYADRQKVIATHPLESPRRSQTTKINCATIKKEKCSSNEKKVSKRCPHLDHFFVSIEIGHQRRVHRQQECVALSGSSSPSHAPTLTVTPFTSLLWSQGQRSSVKLLRIQNAAPSGS